MRILLVDYISGYGHRSFNRIHINAIRQIGAELYLLSQKGFFDYLQDDSLIKLSIPSYLFKTFKTRLFSQIFIRLYDILKLCFVKKTSKKYDPDIIIFLDYDILSFFTFRAQVPVALINHFNVDDMNNRWKLKLTKLLPTNYSFVNLNDFINARQIDLLPNSKSFVIPHGLDYTKMKVDRSLLEEMHLETYIFCPISSSFNKTLLNEILTSKDVKEYLLKNNIKICLKGEVDDYRINDRIVVCLPNYINDILYSSIVCCAFAVFLPYDDSFRYRVSGVLHECFSHNIPAICSHTDAFQQYKRYFNYNPFVSNDAELISAMNSIKNTKLYYKWLDELSPVMGWKMLVNNMVNL